MATIPCKVCGKPIEVMEKQKKRMYCSESCRKKAFMAKKNGFLQQKLSKPLVPTEQCGKCHYGAMLENIWRCGYFEETGHTRTSLHPEGLTSHCYEFMPKKRGRKNRGIRISHNPEYYRIMEENQYGQEEAIHILRQLLRCGEEAE